MSVPNLGQLDLAITGMPQDPESLALSGSNVQEVSITDLISEGPIEGLVNGEASIYLAGDQLSDTNTAAISSSTPESATDEVAQDTELLISIPNITSDGPVTATLKDKGGTTTYLSKRDVTADDPKVFCWLTVENLFHHKVRIRKFKGFTKVGTRKQPGYAQIIAWDGSMQGFFKDAWRITDLNKHNETKYNLKPVVRLVSSSGETLEGSLYLLYNDTEFGQLNSGSNITTGAAYIKLHRPYRNSLLEKDIWVDSSNEVTIDFHLDYVAAADVKLDSGNKVIYIPNWTKDAGTVTNKKYSLSESIDTKSTEIQHAGGTPESTKKYPGSSFEFRVGSLEQKPIQQLAGTGTGSFPVTLTQAQAANFTSTNTIPNTYSAGYPTATQLDALKAAGAAHTTITFSESFSGAQINEIDEITIHFEFPGGHYAALDDGTETFSGAAFHISLKASQTGGTDATDWTDITAGDFNYHIIGYGTKKTAVSYIVTIDVSTHLILSDLQLHIVRLTPNGQSLENPGKLVRQGDFLKSVTQSDPDIVSVIDGVKINQIVATIKEKLSYPYSAIASVNFSSKSFASPPKRAYHVRGLKVAIPGNYTPRHLSETGKAVYTGIWNGEFSNEGTSNASGLDLGTYYTDNPAWIFYDILINNRYGLGKWLKSQDINVYQLYRIAKYCDEEVPTVDGGVEPRFTTNLYLTKATEAYKVLKDMATIFRGMVYWLDGQLTTIPDMPATPIYNFSIDNIIEDSLNSESTGSKTRTNQYTVIWNNPAAGYKQEPLVVEDKKNIIETKRIINRKCVAFGCTSEGQALRFGRWKAWTAINQTEIAKFKTSINASFLRPGDVVNIQDVNDTGIAFSGRITNSTSSAITLDKDIATVSDKAQTDGGRTRQYEFGTTANGFSYKLALLVLVRKIISAQDAPIVVTHGGTTYTYNRGDEVSFAKINGTSTVLMGVSDSDEQIEKNILNVEDDDGKLVVLQFQNSTTVETKDFDSTDVSVVNGVTQIAINNAYSGTIPDHTIWSIREISDGANTTPSYKEFKILGLKEDKDKNWDISAVEFYNSKYDAVDKDFILGVQDPENPPEADFVPAPGAIYLLNDADWRSQLEEIVIQWETPRNSDGTLYESISGYAIHVDPPLPDGTDLIPIKNPQLKSHRVLKIPNGVFNFGVQTFSAVTHKRSKIKWASVNIVDKYKVSCTRTKEGVPSGIRANTKGSKAKNDSTSAGTTWSLLTKDWALQSNGDPGVTVNNANQNTVTTYQQNVTAMATNGKEITAAFIYFDADDTTDYFKLVTHTIFKCENTTLTYWQDYDQFATNSENVWTDCTNSADARVKLHKYSNKVEKSEGTTAFTTRFQVGDLIRVKTASNTYYGGRVAFIESDDVLYTNVQLNGTGSDLTSVDESKAIARNALRPDYATDAVIARINRNGSNYTHISIKWIEDQTLEGLRALIVDPNISFLNYNSSSVLQNEAAITISADALAYDDPEFIITGAGFSQTSESAQSTYVNDDTSGLSAPNDVTGQTLTWKLHDGTSGIGYDNGSSLNFSVTVRESTDQSESKTKDFKIVKVQDGSIGVDGKTVSITADDNSVIYDEDFANPVYNSTNGDIVLTATAHNFTDAIYKFTRTGPGSDVVLQDWSDTSTWTFLDDADWTDTGAGTLQTREAIPPIHAKADWPRVYKVEVGEKPSGWSAPSAPTGNVAIDTTSIVGLAGEGIYGVTISQPNHSHSYLTPADGTFTGIISGSGTTIEVFRGDLIATYAGKTDGTTGLASGNEASMAVGSWYISSITVTGSDVTLGGPTSVSNNIVTISDHTATSNTDNTEAITYTIRVKSRKAKANPPYVIWEKTTVQTLTKALGGAAGDSGTTVDLSSSDWSISYDANGANPSFTAGPVSGKIRITATPRNFTTPLIRIKRGSTYLTGTPYANGSGSYNWADEGTLSVDYTIPTTISTGTTHEVVTVEVAEKPAAGQGRDNGNWPEDDTIAAEDQANLHSFVAGTEGMEVSLGNPNHGVSANNAGQVSSYSGSGTTVEFFADGVQKNYDSTWPNANNTWIVTGVTSTNSSNWSYGGNSNTSTVYTLNDHGYGTGGSTQMNDNETITIAISYKNASGKSFALTARQHLYKVKAGSDSTAQGTNAPKALSGFVYYQTAVTDANAPGTPSATNFNFNTGAFTGLTNNWGTSPPTYDAQNTTTAYWYSYYTTTQTVTNNVVQATGPVTFTTPAKGVAFTGLVTFTALETDTNTTIHGGNITTGKISAISSGTASYGTDADGNVSSSGLHIDLDKGRLRSPHFYIDGSGAKFKGVLEATSGYIGSTVDGWRIKGYRIMGGGYGTISASTDWPNANITLDSQNKRIVIRDTTSETAGVNRVVLGNMN